MLAAVRFRCAPCGAPPECWGVVSGLFGLKMSAYQAWARGGLSWPWRLLDPRPGDGLLPRGRERPLHCQRASGDLGDRQRIQLLRVWILEPDAWV